MSKGDDISPTATIENNNEVFRNPPSFIGRLYELQVEHGSHETTLFGRVEGIQFSDEIGLEFHVSNTEFWGAPLRSLVHHEGNRWYLRTSDPKNRYVGRIKFVT